MAKYCSCENVHILIYSVSSCISLHGRVLDKYTLPLKHCNYIIRKLQFHTVYTFSQPFNDNLVRKIAQDRIKHKWHRAILGEMKLANDSQSVNRAKDNSMKAKICVFFAKIAQNFAKGNPSCKLDCAISQFLSILRLNCCSKSRSIIFLHLFLKTFNLIFFFH